MTRFLAGAAAVLAFAALVVGAAPPPGGVGIEELRPELESREPFVDALTLAEWIRDRRPVRVLDLQGPEAHVRFSIPTARHLEPRAVPRLARTDTPTVLYDDGTGTAVRGWLLLRRLGHPQVLILDRGVTGWVEGVLEPVLPVETPEQKALYDRTAAVSRYFGGMPRTGTRPPRPPDAEDAVLLLSRRGCY